MKVRIDKLLLDKNLAPSRAKAQAMIMAGIVLVNDKRVEKPSETFNSDEEIRIKGAANEIKFVGRGGLKLEKALNEFHINVNECVCMDVGSSTGGFTDCLLKNGASRVYAIDVGTNQLVWKLRTDPRVVVFENTNARNLSSESFPEKFYLIVIDVSFISLTKILSGLLPLLHRNGKIIALIKPQFEVGKGEVGKGGVVKDKEKQAQVVNEINKFAKGLGLFHQGTIESPITGAAGNKEFLSCYEFSGAE